MASAGFVRYTGYDNADIFKNMLIEAYAAAKKNGLFFEGKIPMASTAEVSAAANYAAGDFSDVKSVKAGLQSWLSTQRIECDAGAMAEALTEASRNCGANGRNTYLVIFCWLMKYLAVRPQSLVLIGAASLRELYFLHIMNLAGVRIVYVSYGMDKDFDKFPHANRVQNMTGSMSGMIQMDFSHIDLSKAAQMSQMRASAQQVENTVQRLSTTAAGIFEDFMTEHRTRVVKNGGVFREGGVIPVYFAALIGYDEEAVYNNMLLKFKEGFAGSKKQLIFIEKPMENPTAEEIRQLGTAIRYAPRWPKRSFASCSTSFTPAIRRWFSTTEASLFPGCTAAPRRGSTPCSTRIFRWCCITGISRSRSCISCISCRGAGSMLSTSRRTSSFWISRSTRTLTTECRFSSFRRAGRAEATPARRSR